MLRILTAPWDFLKWLFALAFPMFRGGTGNTAGIWAARGVLLAVVLAGLTFLNQALGWDGWIQYGTISRYWLPLLAFCLYGMIWTGWWLYRLFNIDIPEVKSDYPDIDHAWKEAVEALDRAGIHLDNTPLFLVLGESASGEEALFQSAAIKAPVKQVPREPTQPLHVTANNDGIWVTCLGTSVLGQHLLAYDEASDASGEVSLETLVRGETADPFKTMGMGGGETLRIEDFVNSLKKAEAQARIPRRSGKTVDIETYRSRLRHLCRLIARDRLGLCPLNGILVVLPVALVESRGSLADICTACKTDLTDALEALRMRCPVVFLVSDLDRLPGFVDLAERLPAEQRRKRMGQRFPLVPELDHEDVPARIKDSVFWTGSTLFLSMVQSLFRVESAGGEDVTEVTRANSQLYRFLAALRDRRERLSQFVRDCLPYLESEPILFRGCYFAGTGRDSVTGQAFAAGVFRLLIDEQEHVTWTSRALLEDAASLRMARLLKMVLVGAIGLGLVAICCLIGWKFCQQGPRPGGVSSVAAVRAHPLPRSIAASPRPAWCLL